MGMTLKETIEELKKRIASQFRTPDEQRDWDKIVTSMEALVGIVDQVRALEEELADLRTWQSGLEELELGIGTRQGLDIGPDDRVLIERMAKEGEKKNE